MNAAYFLSRVGKMIALLFIVITINFFIARFMPGDVIRHLLGEEEYLRLRIEAPEVIEETRVRYGLDQPLPVQYQRYLAATFSLQFGNSYTSKEPVVDKVLYHMKWTLLLAVPAAVICGIIGGVAGLLAGWNSRGLLNRMLTPFFVFLSAVPSNCVAMIFLLVFAFRLGWFPLSGMTSGGLFGVAKAMDILWHMALPLAIMILYRSGGNFINMKSYAASIRSEDYITTAVSKGLPGRRVLTRHGLRNIVLPYISLMCMQFGSILAGTMMVEVVFTWRGMGQLTYAAAMAKDYPTLQFAMLLSSACVLFFNLLSDILCFAVDPRLRSGSAHE